MKIKDISDALNRFAPSAYMESYDNTGLLIGDFNAELKGVLCCHDLNHEIMDEAIEKACNLIVCHHPPIFNSIKSVIKDSDKSGLIYRAVQEGLSVYSTHTALDNRIYGGNSVTAKKLGLLNLKILKPQTELLSKLFTYCPAENVEKVKTALFEAGGGSIGNYSECSFESSGKGNFTAGNGANPYVGEIGQRHTENETKLEIVFESKDQRKVLKALFDSHPYEEVAFEVIELKNTHSEIGSGLIGEFEEAINQEDFLMQLKTVLGTPSIKHTKIRDKKIKKVALCGGSGSFLINDAISSGADAYLSGDIGYHYFFDANGKILLCDAGHFETEQFVKESLYSFLNENFANFAVHLADTNTNPVKYF